MSLIEDLLQELCPAGVEHVDLGSVVRIRNGSDYKALGAGDVPVYGSGGVMTFVDTPVHDGPSVLIPRKGSLGNLFYVDEPFWTVDTIFYTEMDASRLIPKFFYYVMFTQRLAEKNQAGGVPSMTQSCLKRLRIPVPPLEVQREIVRVLNKFTQLEAELEAELEARRTQYEHYRTELLTFGDGVPRRLLGDIATIGTGSHDTKDATADGEFLFYARGREPLRLDSYDFNERAIITAGDGVGVGKVFHFADGKYALHQRAYRVVPGEQVDSRFIYHYLVSDFSRYLEGTSVHASVTSLRRPMFLKYPVPVPPRAEQERIVATLDKLDALVNDISIGLPAELNARRKQYEYYRERLLTFKEAV
ncbi:restriction endonuclease subunit S [Pseudoclavibacter helvolus]|uniref:restriction endonuclease subunit S n=1 Tax=Pseudoclavibacter helvolus TaxID=255205 RepID=UPI0024AE4171|nr:restriction endonuclease subunit S [Pseudoclavibacter helvolus]